MEDWNINEEGWEALLSTWGEVINPIGLRQAQKIIGSKKKLETLLLSGKIRYTKVSEFSNAKWYLNAGDVLRHTKIRKNIKDKKKQKLLWGIFGKDGVEKKVVTQEKKHPIAF